MSFESSRRVPFAVLSACLVGWTVIPCTVARSAGTSGVLPSTIQFAVDANQGEKLPKPAPDMVAEASPVVRGGVRYRVFKSEYGTLLVPAVGSWKESDLEGALCGDELPPQRPYCDESWKGLRGSDVSPTSHACDERRENDPNIQRRLASSIETKPVGGMVAYASAIIKATRTRCGESARLEPLPLNAGPEIGLRWPATGGREKELFWQPMPRTDLFGLRLRW